MLLLVPFALAADPVLLPDARFALALFCNPTCTDGVLDQLDADLASIDSIEGFSDFQGKPARVMGIAGADFGIPDDTFLAAYGVDVDRADALKASQQVVVAWFAGPRDDAVNTFATAHAAFSRAAATANGWVEDLDTQRIYGAAAWAKTNPKGNLEDWYTIEPEPMVADQPEGRVRLVTRGLRRYGDIELVVEDIDPALAPDVSLVVAGVAREIEQRGEAAASMPIDEGTVRGTATLSWLSNRRDTDPESPIARVKFDGRIGEDPPPVASPPVASLVPPPAPVPTRSGPPRTGAAAPQTLTEARAAVQRELGGRVKTAFTAGLPAGDKLALNAPFPTTKGGREYLWIEVERWTGDTLTGTLVTQPSAVDGLEKGDKVTLREADVFDYVWKHADGAKEGNLTRGFVR